MPGLPGLKKIRTDAGFTQKELAAKTSLGAQSIYYYESGERNPSLEVTTNIANALSCTVDDLLQPDTATNQAPKTSPAKLESFRAAKGLSEADMAELVALMSGAPEVADA